MQAAPSSAGQRLRAAAAGAGPPAAAARDSGGAAQGLASGPAREPISDSDRKAAQKRLANAFARNAAFASGGGDAAAAAADVEAGIHDTADSRCV